MKVILMSDSHGRNSRIDEILELHPDADAYFHCGDIECDEFYYPNIRTVCGNNDYYDCYPEKMVFQLGNHRILMMHSHRCYYSKRFEHMAQLAKEAGCDTVFYGHTHVASDKVVNGVRLINPGSLYYSRDGRPISYCVITIEDEMIVEFQFAPFE